MISTAQARNTKTGERPIGTKVGLKSGMKAENAVQPDLRAFATSDEMQNQRDDGRYEQQVNEKAAHMQDEEAAKPEQNQHDSKNEKHH